MSDITRIVEQDYNTFFLIAGPCVVESAEICYRVGGVLQEICARLGIPYVFKSSFRKANRSAGSSYRGIGDDKAMRILADIKSNMDIPVTTDVHEVKDIDLVKEVVDIIQIPAFLCRQTDLIEAAARTRHLINIKKGQFMSGEAMMHAVQKVQMYQEHGVMLTERGNSFGYQDLIVDVRNIERMSTFATAIMDCTHATQRPNQPTGVTGGDPSEIELFAKMGLIGGAKGLFIEMHPQPTLARSDAGSMLPLAVAAPMLERLQDLATCHQRLYA